MAHLKFSNVTFLLLSLILIIASFKVIEVLLNLLEHLGNLPVTLTEMADTL